MNAPTFTVDADLLARASLCVSADDEVRPALAGVHVEPERRGGVWLVSTDSRKMVVIRDHDGKCSGHVTVTVTKAVARACKSRVGEPPRVAVLKAGSLAISTSAGSHILTAVSAIIDGIYPPWRKAIPKQIGTSIPNGMAWDVEHETPLAKALSRECSGLAYYVSGGPHDALLVVGNDSIDAFGVLMPMRTNPAIPPAYRQLAAEKAAA